MTLSGSKSVTDIILQDKALLTFQTFSIDIFAETIII